MSVAAFRAMKADLDRSLAYLFYLHRANLTLCKMRFDLLWMSLGESKCVGLGWCGSFLLNNLFLCTVGRKQWPTWKSNLCILGNL